MFTTILQPLLTSLSVRQKSSIFYLTTFSYFHLSGEKTAGINVRRGCITNILEENVVQPVLVCTTAISQATETVRAILKIDDIVQCR